MNNRIKISSTIILFIYCTMSYVSAQPQLTFRFSNPQLIELSLTLSFDIEVKADTEGSFHRDLQLYLQYNPLAFGEDIVANNAIEITDLELMSDHYQLVNVVDNTDSKLSIITEAIHEMTEPGNAGFFNEIPTEFTGLFHIEILIADQEQLAGISFDPLLMNAGQYFQDVTEPAPMAYMNPCLYENDLMDLLLGGQKLEIPQGWSGISSYMDPETDDVETLFAPVVNDLIILQNNTGFWWPGQNINTLINWDTHQGYLIKMAEQASLTINGQRENNKSVELSAEWNLIPVLSSCDANVAQLFDGIDPIIVKEVAGWNIYWPEFGINTLDMLQPGKAYFVMMEEEAEVTFPECDGMKSSTIKFEDALSESSYRPLLSNSPTANTHSIAVSSTNLSGFCRAYDDQGNLFGAGELSENYITLFGDDPLTEEKDGFYENDHFVFTWIDTDSGAEQKLEVSFDPSLPDHDGTFSTNGISAIELLSVGSTLVSNRSDNSFEVYPNPVDETLYVQKSLDGAVNISIISIQGTQVYNRDFVSNKTEIDISSLPAGVYFVKLSSEKATTVKRVIIK